MRRQTDYTGLVIPVRPEPCLFYIRETCGHADDWERVRRGERCFKCEAGLPRRDEPAKAG